MTNKNCDYCNSCYYCYYCDYCYFCYSCDYCDYCNYCYFCYSCDYCDYCNYCNSCDYSKGLRMSEKMIFCLGSGRGESEGEGYQKNYRIFNKDVGRDEWNKIKESLKDIKVKLAEYKDDELVVYEYEEAWKNWLKQSTKEQRQAILNTPQFDEKIFTGITGLTKKALQIDSDTVEITCEGKTVEISRESAKTLNLIK